MAEFERQQVKRIMGELNDVLSGVCIELAVDINRSVARATPKRTGLTAANWIASKGVSKDEPILKKSAAVAAQKAGLVSIETFDAARDKKIIISNNLGHISALNAGASRKAPAGFVQLAIAGAVSRLGRITRLRRRGPR